jgi:hypothetical protein
LVQDAFRNSIAEMDDLMNWKHGIRRNLVFSVVGGVTMHAIYFALLFTNALHGFAVKALGPAIELVWGYLDPKCYTRKYCMVEEYFVSIVLYTFWIFIALMSIDLLRQLKRKPLG